MTAQAPGAKAGSPSTHGGLSGTSTPRLFRLVAPQDASRVAEAIRDALGSRRPEEPAESPYGDGHAAERIVAVLAGDGGGGGESVRRWGGGPSRRIGQGEHKSFAHRLGIPRQRVERWVGTLSRFQLGDC